MSRKSTIYKVPENLLIELKDRHIKQPILTLDDHKQWLADQGFVIPRTIIWRYLKREDNTSIEKASSDTFTKIVCLEIASKFASNKSELLALSRELHNWVNENN